MNLSIFNPLTLAAPVANLASRWLCRSKSHAAPHDECDDACAAELYDSSAATAPIVAGPNTCATICVSKQIVNGY